MRFSNQTDTSLVNLLEHKLNIDVTRFCSSIFVVEIQRPMVIVHNDDDRSEVSLLFVISCSTHLR
jgi:hypothetical protein